MKYRCCTPVTLTLLLIGSPADRAQEFMWAGQLEGGILDKGEGVAVDANGGVYAVGSFQGTVDFDPGLGAFNLTASGNDVYLLKLDIAGHFVWVRHIGGASSDIGHSIVLDSNGNIHFVGEFGGSVDFDPGPGVFTMNSPGRSAFVSKFDSAGELVWARQFAGSEIEAEGVAVDTSGNVYSVGRFQESADFDPGGDTYNLTPEGGFDVFVSKLDSEGDFAWAAQLEGADNDLGHSVAVDANDNVYTVGRFQATADFDPGVGSYELTSAGNYDAFASKLDSMGSFVWARQLSGTSDVVAQDVVVDANDNVYIVGYFFGTADFDPGPGSLVLTAGGSDIFVLKLDSAGNLVWARQMGGSSGDSGSSIALDVVGSVYSVGDFSQSADFDPGPGVFNMWGGSRSAFVSKLTNGGNFVWARHMGGGPGLVFGNSATVDESGRIYTVGVFAEGTADFDPGPDAYELTAGFDADVFISKLGPVPDGDGDAYSPIDGDCDDTDAMVFPEAPQLCDGVNNDCLDAQWPIVPTDEQDADDDSYRICANDCDDDNPLVNPGVSEICNTVDDDCDTLIDEDELGEDTDSDGVHNLCDNCREHYNPTQQDTDDDTVGNACDNCIIDVNPNQEDLDSDLRGDVCDNCVSTYNPLQDDYEEDGVGDACDNCYFDHNPSQSDFDADFEGDHCDLDDGLIYVFFDRPDYVDCQPESGYDNWNFYRGNLSFLRASCEPGPCEYAQAPGSNDLARRDCSESNTWVPDFDDPDPGQAAYFLATGNAAGAESDLGQDSAGNPRPNDNPCP